MRVEGHVQSHRLYQHHHRVHHWGVVKENPIPNQAQGHSSTISSHYTKIMSLHELLVVMVGY